MTALVRLPHILSQRFLTSSVEFLISDLALASYSIPSFVLSSLSLLSPVLDSHPPSVIITHATFLSNLLELIYDSNDSAYPIIVVVGDVDDKVIATTGQISIVKWEEVERRGTQGSRLPFSTPGELLDVTNFPQLTDSMCNRSTGCV